MLVVPYYDEDTYTFSYVIADEDAGEAAIVDPVAGFDPASGQIDWALADRQLEFLTGRGLDLRWILETHVHADHLSAASYLREKTGASVVIGRGITEVQRRFALVYHLGDDFPMDGSQFDQLLDDGEELPLGDERIRVMNTPGHTGDSISYRVNNTLFVGDTLFRPEYGTARCDFPGGDAAVLYRSIQQIYALPPSTRIYLCHDYPAEGQEARCETTVAESSRHNIHLQAHTTEKEFVALRTTRDATLSMPKLILPAIQVNMRAGQLPAPDANGVSYLRLPVNADLGVLAR